MLRMGRSPRVEPNESERPATAQPQQQHTTPVVSQQSPQTYQQPTNAGPVQPARVETATPSTPRAVTETEVLARELKEGIMSGFLGSNTVLTGDAEFKGMLRIDGRFTGRITSEKGTLIVSAGGIVDADLRVGTARVNGTVNGDIIATERIEMGRSAQVRGNIQTPVLVVEQGAIFEGGCRMTQVKADVVKIQQPSEKVAAATVRPAAPVKQRPATPPPTDIEHGNVTAVVKGEGSSASAVGTQAAG